MLPCQLHEPKLLGHLPKNFHNMCGVTLLHIEYHLHATCCVVCTKGVAHFLCICLASNQPSYVHFVQLCNWNDYSVGFIVNLFYSKGQLFEDYFVWIKEKCSSKTSFVNDDLNSIEKLIGRLRRLKDDVGFADLSEANCHKTCINMCSIL